MKKTNGIAIAIVLFMLSILGACSPAPQSQIAEPVSQPAGQIYLYGEAHAVEKILDKELELWQQYYEDQGMRHMFIEYPYYTAQFLNLWMQSDNDDMLDAVYDDWGGSAAHDPSVKEFFQSVKSRCPETVFHGTDVGHQYYTTGERYLKLLGAQSLQDSEEYLLAQETIEQGKHYYLHSNNVYRENTMAQNFIREFDKLSGENVMGIYGSAHTDFDAMDYYTKSVPCMANQLKERYGDTIHTEDLTWLEKAIEPSRVDKIQVEGTEYEAPYFGSQDLTGFSKEYVCRDFWRLENAYDSFVDKPKTGNVLPFDNYPMLLETGQVFIIDYTKTDGTVERNYYRSDGYVWEDKPSTEEFVME